MITLTINGEKHELDVPDQMPLLWALRDVVQLSGTKFGCGMALCGACTIHLDGKAIRSCITPVSLAKDKSVATIEAVGNDRIGQRVQQAWLDLASPVRLLSERPDHECNGASQGKPQPDRRAN